MSVKGLSIVVLVMTGALCNPPPTHPDAIDGQALSDVLSFSASSPKQVYSLGDVIPVDLSLRNLTERSVAVRKGSMSHQLNYSFIDPRDGSTHVGSVLGERFPTDAVEKSVVLNDHEAVVVHVELRELMADVVNTPGVYTISFEYCEWEDATRCVESNAVEIRVAAADEQSTEP